MAVRRLDPGGVRRRLAPSRERRQRHDREHHEDLPRGHAHPGGGRHGLQGVAAGPAERARPGGAACHARDRRDDPRPHPVDDPDRRGRRHARGTDVGRVRLDHHRLPDAHVPAAPGGAAGGHRPGAGRAAGDVGGARAHAGRRFPARPHHVDPDRGAPGRLRRRATLVEGAGRHHPPDPRVRAAGLGPQAARRADRRRSACILLAVDPHRSPDLGRGRRGRAPAAPVGLGGAPPATWIRWQAFGAPFVVGFPVGVAYFAKARPKLVAATRVDRRGDPSLAPATRLPSEPKRQV